MSKDDLHVIVHSRLARAEMTISERALHQITNLSQGLPHYTHLLGLYSGLEANDQKGTEVGSANVQVAIRKAVDKAQESIKSAHYNAVISQRRDNLYTK